VDAARCGRWYEHGLIVPRVVTDVTTGGNPQIMARVLDVEDQASGLTAADYERGGVGANKL
jgi:hypothetical protein